MKFLLDTNAVIALLNADAIFLRLIRQYVPSDFSVSVVVFHELYFGAFKSRRQTHNLGRIEALKFAVIEFDKEDARDAAELRAALAAAGTPIGHYDLLIAGQARNRGLTLITHNTREFARVSGLRLMDWHDS